MTTFIGGGGSEWAYMDTVFIIESLVGFSWGTGNPYESPGAVWWDQSLLPASGTDRFVIPGGAGDLGDLTGDGIDDLVIRGVPTGEAAEQAFIAPGPLTSFQQPVIDHQGLLPHPYWETIPFGNFAKAIPHCGDLNGDGIEDRCSTMQVEFGPYEGTADWQREHQDLDERGFTADLDGDGVQELYIIYDDSVERFTFTPDGPNPGVFEGIGPLYWTMDLDSDGVDEIYTGSPNGPVRITNAGFLANTIEPSPLTGRYPNALYSGDFDGDGETEVLTWEGSAVFLYETDGTQVLQLVPDGSDADFGRSVDIGDADGNGTDDIVFGTADGWSYYLPNPLDCLP